MTAGPSGPVLNQLTRRQLGLQRLAYRRCRRGLRRRAILFNLFTFDLLDGGAVAQTVACRFRADLDDLEIVLFARRELPCALQRPGCRSETRWSLVTALALFNLRVMAKRLYVFPQFDERAERGDTRNLAFHDLPDLVLFKPVAPNIVDLLDAQRHAAVLRIDLEHLGSNVFALLEYFVRVLHAPGPAYVSDVHQPVKAVLDLHERAELRDVPHLAGHHRAHRIFLCNQQPGVRLGLLDSQRYAPVARLDFQHHDIHFFANFDDLRGVLDLFIPAQLGHVYQAFDPLFQLHEHAIVHDSDDFALHLSAARIFLRRSHPPIGHQW